MRVFIPIHSVVDVITNSSSVIYTEASRNSVKLLKDIINEVLKVAGSDKTADDLFEITTQVRPNDIEDWVRYDGVENHPELASFKDIDYGEAPTWDRRMTLQRQWIAAHQAEIDAILNKIISGEDYDFAEGRFARHLIVTSKDGAPMELVHKAMSLFDTTESYEG